jgi:hypothetical protein
MKERLTNSQIVILRSLFKRSGGRPVSLDAATAMMIDEEMEHQQCIVCGVHWLMPQYILRKRRQDKTNFYCPNGHPQCFRESDADRLRRERDILQQQIARVEDEKREQIERALRAEKETARLKKRASAGVCPCCNRTFLNMQRHMKAKHPNIVPLKTAQS